MRRVFLLFLFVLLGFVKLWATHNRAGEITYVQIGELTIRATVTTYTKESSRSADRDSVQICWGDEFSQEDCQWVVRVNGPGNPPQGESLPNDTKINFYIAEHTYPGRGHYRLSMTDPNRNGDILNVNFPNSDNVQFHLETTVTFLNPQFQGTNSTPLLTQPPIDIGCVGQKFVHIPGAIDIDDNDSIAYRLIIPLQDRNTPVPNYNFPREIRPGPLNNHSFNEATGEFIWTAPQQAGEYNIAMFIIEFRDGQPLDTLIRDLQILIVECDNMPPEIVADTEDEICVIAGELIEFNVTATAPLIESTQRVDLQAFGGPMIVPQSPAQLLVPPGYQAQPLQGTFRWQTACEHISDQFYSVTFRAADDFPLTRSNPGVGGLDTLFLSTLKTIRIKVVGPPPEDLQVLPGDGEVALSWAKPYVCEETDNDYFLGFSVWRREGSNGFAIDTCTPGLDGRGYTKIEFNTTAMENGRYVYTDSDVERGRTYCYRILAEFARTSAGGFPFNIVESLPSQERCTQLSRDIPLITNVDVRVTDAADGQIEVRWSKPKAEDLDTIRNPGPYRYVVLRAIGITQTGLTEVPGASFTSNTFAGANDTVFVDSGLNTIDNPYSYQVAFYVNNEAQPLGFTEVASSVFLSIAPTDQANVLSWQEDVPWDNTKYDIFRRDPGSTEYDSIGTVGISTFRDENLINGEEYCYLIRSEGSYGIEGIVNPLINHSQEVCAIPNDNVAPCAPELMVSNICDQATNEDPPSSFLNDLVWTNPNNSCSKTSDVEQYNIYFTPTEGGELVLIETIDSADDTLYSHQPEVGIAGCYAVTAIDTTGNESEFSNVVCVDNCPVYELPNVFTPNNDQANDLYVPINSRFIERIEIKILNRWGQLVFESTDPEINWDGTNLNGDELAEGTYFYTCLVFENRVTGIIQTDVLSGYIELIRGR